ncbi:MAG: DUF3857 domain-containing protein [Candidatus Acidiferrum sp.]
MRRAVIFCAILSWFACGLAGGQAQEPAGKPAAKVPEEKSAPNKDQTPDKPQLPFQIQLLETRMRFEANGDSRKEVHTIVKIVNILGAKEFARISFDYDRAFQQVEIPMVRVNHANGGTSEVLPSAVTDTPNAAVEQFPVYQDVRVKSVRILGLQEGDTVEYRVITTTTKHPLAPDFWLEHTFDRSGQVLEEHYELDLPTSRKAEPRINPEAPPASRENTGSGETAFTIYRWRRTYSPPKDGAATEEANPDTATAADVAVSTFTWDRLSSRLAEMLFPGARPIQEIHTREGETKEPARRPEVAAAVGEKALSLTREAKSDGGRLEALYEFVATHVNTVDLPLGTTGFRSRAPADILISGYATGEDKYVLFSALAAAVGLRADAALTGFCDKKALAAPLAFKHLVILAWTKEQQYWLDPAVEVAPFGVISPTEAKCAFLLRRDFSLLSAAAGQEWVALPTALPFAAFQKVSVDAAIAEDGQLTAKVKYVLRGENELLLRVAFHQAPKDKWKDIANLLAISDGFRGQVTRAQASDPLSTEDAFTVEYDLTQLKFVDWSKKPVRIPALLPQIGLPEMPLPSPQSKGAPKIVLGTPLDVQTSMTLKLPEGITVQTPAGSAVARDYATYTSKYSSTLNTVVASRRIDFLKREILGDRAMDYNAFSRVVQNDQAQRLILIAPAGWPTPKAVEAPAKP